MDLPMPYDVSYDEATGCHMEKPPERTYNSSCITLSIIIGDTLSHHFNPRIPASEEASADLT